jgi:hypothetical protein
MISGRYQENVTKIINIEQFSTFVYLARKKVEKGNGYSLLYTKLQEIHRGEIRRTNGNTV